MDCPAETADALRSLLSDQDPPDMVVPPVLANVRHECGEGRQRALPLRERYEYSEDREWAILWREGTCRRCGMTMRSEGRIVRVSERPPLTGRVAR